MKKILFCTLIVLVFGQKSGVCQVNQSISLPAGWSIFSTYIAPQNPDIANVLLPVYPEVKIVKSGSGQVFWPQFNINGIGNMQTGAGYQIKMNNAQSLVISGTPLDPLQISLLLPFGWSILGYLHQSPALLINMLSPISSKLVIVKNGSGQIYWPQFNVNSIVTLFPGQGYIIKLTDTSLFSYPGLVPVVQTADLNSITDSTANCGGNITFPGGNPITARGVCWNLTGGPTIADTHTTDGMDTGGFSSTLSGLSSNTSYFVKAYASNIHGTSYGNEVSFTTTAPLFSCGTSMVSDIDGNTYNTVQMGNQCWMKENIKTTHYSNGTAIPLVTDNSLWNQLLNTSKGYCYYNNSASNGTNFGALYTWVAAMNGMASSNGDPSGVQGVCPDGWHIPGDNEWKQMEMSLGLTQAEADAFGARGTNQGGQLKATTSWNNPNTGASNSSGFTALPAGIREPTGPFSTIGNNGYWWTATEYSSNHAMVRFLYYNNAQVHRNALYKGYGISVRCIKDN